MNPRAHSLYGRFTPTGVGTAGSMARLALEDEVHPHGRGDGESLREYGTRYRQVHPHGRGDG